MDDVIQHYQQPVDPDAGRLRIAFRADERYDGTRLFSILDRWENDPRVWSESDPWLARDMMGIMAVRRVEQARMQRAWDGFAPHAPMLRPDWGPEARGTAVRTTAWDPESPVHWVQTVPAVRVEMLHSGYGTDLITGVSDATPRETRH